MRLGFIVLQAVVLMALTAPLSAQVEANEGTVAIDARVTMDQSAAIAATVRRGLRRYDRRSLRLERAGWSLVGVAVAAGLTVGILAAQKECDCDDFICFEGPGFAAGAGFAAALPALVIGTLLGSSGTKRRRRAQRAGNWSLSLQGRGARFALVF